MNQTVKKRVVVVGGGTGTHTILRGLKTYSDIFDITAIVTMADSGGSTGRLRDEFGQLPVGDVRMALAALASAEGKHDELLRELFLYRFSRGDGLAGHTFGNLFLTALTDILGSSSEAIGTAGRILRVSGEVIPVTTDNVHLKATYDDGHVVVGEHHIDVPPASRHHNTITHLELTPRAILNPAAAAALEAADLIIFGPGDLYTSILANCVVDGFASAVAKSQAVVVYVSNLMSRPGQTSGMHSAEHAAEIAAYLGRWPDYVLINSAPFPVDILARYNLEKTYPVENNSDTDVCTVHVRDLVATESIVTVAGDVIARSLIRHDSIKLAEAIVEIAALLPRNSPRS